MKGLISFFMFALMINGCGKQTERREKMPEIDVITAQITSSEPIFMVKQSTSCQETSFTETKLDILLNLFLDGAETSGQRNFLSLFRGLNVRSADKKVVSRTIYGVHEQTIPRGEFKYVEVIKHNEGKDVTVCPEEEQYDRNTVESAALNATYFINKTHRAVTTADKKVKLAPIKLVISPKIQTSFRTSYSSQKLRSVYKTDNAYYYPAEKSITFLPHSKSWRNNGILASFWEVPMVASHEYGHHIFQTLVDLDRGNDTSLHQGNTSCFGHQVLDNAESSLATRTQKAMILSAFNEGFADLISFYSLSDEERTLKGVKCLEVSRDVGSPTFYDGIPKTFTNYVVTRFLTPANFVQDSLACEYTSFQSIHHIGAIFAHNADKIVSLFSTTKEEKLATTLEWARRLAKAKNDLASVSNERYIRELFVLYIKTASDLTAKPISKAICDQAELSFPASTHLMTECATQE